MLKGFKDFLMRGNLIELAVALIMATVFAEVVKTFTAVIMDIVGLLFSMPDFSGTQVGGVNLGAFLTALFTFVLTAAVIYFAVVTPYNKYKELRGIKEDEELSTNALLVEIRDLLAGR